ncbi:MAG TPA: nickel pincer cofactor biosynthesis protein LarB [Chloroflexota bacterium]|nr:nickel pincer cofactor biosynthesis protein LarB [Chloroflexota bacterium]
MPHSPLDEAFGAFGEMSADPRADAAPGADRMPLIANGQARPDLRREERTGAPEVIYASGKDSAQIVALTEAFVERTGRAIISRIREDDAQAVLERFADHETAYHRRAAMLVVRKQSLTRPVGGNVGIVTAGTSDLPVAEQVKVIAEEMGCRVSLVSDVGVAGLHRLFGPLRAMLDGGVDVIVVCAGMDGALPSVVSGLVDLPVIGVPTSTGYGVGGNGVAALLSMLQTCAPGLAVVNVDNGVGAGVTAALIANRVARARATKALD